MDFLPQAFELLKQYPQFIIYKLSPNATKPGKFDKFPLNHKTGMKHDAQDPSVWLSADQAIASAKLWGDGHGVGFVITKSDPFFFLDIDSAWDGSQWSPLASELCSRLAGAALEISSSNTGLHLLGVSNVIDHSCRNRNLNIELYTEGRFVALTGIQAQGNISLDCTIQLTKIISDYFPASSTVSDPNWWSDKPVAGWNGPIDDDVLINRALNSQSARKAFGTGASFHDLWTANNIVLGAIYPPDLNSTYAYNASSADAALAAHLAFWTGNDAERIKRLMLKSGLTREKWERPDYLPQTIRTECSRKTEWLCDKPIESITNRTVRQEKPKQRLVTCESYASIEQQQKLFEGCSYVADSHQALIPGGRLVKPEVFKILYGGYSFPLDNRNEKTTRNAWEAFTESQALRPPIADTSTFKPLETPGAVLVDSGTSLANFWWPVETPKIAGDVTLFLNHLKKIVPDETDRQIILAYMAACVQYQGVKFMWCPLVQGVEGNGKTFLTLCVAHAIGARYSYFPKASELAAKFNDWLYGVTFIAVEDVYVESAKTEVLEAMKPMITGERQEIEPKGGKKTSRDICCNFILNTNHKDGLRKTGNDRRLAPFYTAQQTKADLKRDGLTTHYFRTLFKWAKEGGFAAISYFLATYKIPDEFNPSFGDPAPTTTSTNSAIQQGASKIEQEIVEAIEQGLPGFKGGWVSSIALNRLLIDNRATNRYPPNKRRELMQSLGYDWHPGLKEGRVNNVTMIDSGKPRLFICSDHMDAGLTTGAAIAKAYEEAQK